MLRTVLTAALLLAVATLAWADCGTTTITRDGRILTCTTCCLGTSCSTSCF